MVCSDGYRIVIILILTTIHFPPDGIKMSSIGARVLTARILARIQTVSETFPISRTSNHTRYRMLRGL